MSKRSDRAKSRLRAKKREAWFDLPRRFSRYEAGFMALSGIVFLAMAYQEFSGRGIDARTAGTSKSGFSAAPASEAMHYASGTFFGLIALAMIAIGVAGLLTRRR